MRLTARSYAKLNLFLYVTGRRTDGYHTLHSLMVPVTLCDTLFFDFSAQTIQVVCDHPEVPEDDRNLAAKAAALFYTAVANRDRPERPGVVVRIEKQIPVGGGLGGGSSNAACVLAVLNRHYGNPLSIEQLADLGLELGADVPFFLYGRAAIATGVGENLVSCRHLKPYHVVICDPGVTASTRDVYKKVDLRLTKNRNYNIRKSSNICSEEQGHGIGACLHNDLEPAACSLYPRIRDVKEEMAFLLNQKVFMTGSGASLFALYPDQPAAVQAAGVLDNAWQGRLRVITCAFR